MSADGTRTVRAEGGATSSLSREIRDHVPKATAASAAAAANSHIVCHAAFIAYQRGKKLSWDPAKREFTNDDIANRMRSRALREPWRV